MTLEQLREQARAKARAAQARGNTRAEALALAEVRDLSHRILKRDARKGALRNLPRLARPPKGFREDRQKEAAE